MSDSVSLASASELYVEHIPLHSRHLIEASAGTGKTYNITRIYLRLLLEKQLTVQQILVMTFTKAATEELRGRIADELQDALVNWHQKCIDEPYYQSISERVTFEDAMPLLKLALLTLDEASIFTLHGFCNRVVNQQAFSSGLPLELTMESNTDDILLSCVRDWIRLIRHDADAFERLVNEGWHSPERFLNKFSSVIKTKRVVTCATAEQIEQGGQRQIDAVLTDHFNPLKKHVLTALKTDETLLLSTLVHGHKDEAKRQLEWQTLCAWLDDASAMACPKAASDFINGNRYRGKSEIKAVLMPFKELRDAFKKQVSAIELKVQKMHEAQPLNQIIADGVEWIKSKFIEQKRRVSILDFDDLISILSERIAGKDSQALIAELRHLYPAALVDEFQDTDAEQYQILNLLYPAADESLALYMIGDPKQAIYAFRGGDIFTYLAARKDARYLWMMDTNYRSTDAIVTAYNRMFWGAPLEESAKAVFGFSIDYEQIKSTQDAKAASIPFDDPLALNLQVDVDSKSRVLSERAALNFVLYDPTTHSSDNFNTNAASHHDDTELTTELKPEQLRASLADWTAHEIIRLLKETQLKDAALQEQDIAILVRGKTEADAIQYALRQCGLSAVYLSDRTNIYQSQEAFDILYLLEGILHHEDERLLTRAYSTSLLAGSNDLLQSFKDTQQPEKWESAVAYAGELKSRWQKRGVMPMLLSVVQHNYQPEQSDKERGLTNVLHLAELLQQASKQHKHPHQLITWYREQLVLDTAQNEAEQRLESDANLIRIITQHGSKGLEYPVVFIPFANVYQDPLGAGFTKKYALPYYDQEKHQSSIQIGGDFDVQSQLQAESLAENIRLLYVALTRPTHRCYLGLAPFKNNNLSAIGHILKLNEISAKVDSENQNIHTQLASFIQTSNGSSTLISFNAIDSIEHTANVIHTTQPEAYSLKREPDNYWAMHSFSAITRRKNAPLRLGSNQAKPMSAISEDVTLTQSDTVLKADVTVKLTQKERDDDLVNELPNCDFVDTQQATLNGNIPLRFRLAKGAIAGNLLHDILEHTDFSSPDWDKVIDKPLRKYPILKRSDASELSNWLQSVLHASLPNVFSHDECQYEGKASEVKLTESAHNTIDLVSPQDRTFCLADLTFNKTLREAEFYFPIEHVNLTDLAKCLAEYRNVAYVSELMIREKLNGMMHGFIDLIFEWQGRFYVADYKSTHLGDDPLGYNTETMQMNNQHHFYDLQYLIYTVALHRYLALRVESYDIERHLGGVYYLYLRGMEKGNETGVYTSQISNALILKLDALFDGQPLKSEMCLKRNRSESTNVERKNLENINSRERNQQNEKPA